MQMGTQAEKMGVLLTTVADLQAVQDMLRNAAASVAKSRDYRSMVFITPGGAWGHDCLLFSSVVNAAYFLLRHTNVEWTRTCRNAGADETAEMIRVRAFIRNRCNDEEWNSEWWYARDTTMPDGANDYIDNMKDYSIVDMRSYDYTQE